MLFRSHLDRPHRRVGRDDRRTVDVLPFWTRGGGIEQPPPFFCCQRAADRVLTLREIADVVGQRPPPAAGLQYTRQHAYVHVDRAVRDAGLVARALELGDRFRGDRRERHVAEVLLDQTQSLFLEFDRPRRAPYPLRVQLGADPIREPFRTLFVVSEPAMSGLFDQRALSTRRHPQIRRTEPLPVPAAPATVKSVQY